MKGRLVIAFLVLALFPQAGISLDRPNLAAVMSLDELLSVRISTAAKYEQTVGEAPASVTIIAADEIEDYGYLVLADVLQNLRGFYVSDDRNYQYVGARGFQRLTDTNNRVLVLIDGHTTNDNVYSAAGIGGDLGISLEVVERIEVVRGPGSALYGGSAVFAVINIITKTGQTIDGVRFSGTVGSYGEKRMAAVAGRGLDNGTDVVASLLWYDSDGQDLYYEEFDEDSDDPEADDGMATDLDWDRGYSMLGTATHGSLTLRAYNAHRTKGVPTASYETTFNDERSQNTDESRYIEAAYERAVGADRELLTRMYASHYRFRGVYPYEEDEVEWVETAEGMWIGGEARLRWDLRADNRLVVGFEHQEHLQAEITSRDVVEGELYFDGDFPYRVSSLYVQDEYQMRPDLSLTLGLRHDDYSSVGTATTPRIGAIYTPRKATALKLLYGEAFRPPNMYETEYEDEGVTKGNPDLKAEKIRTAEVVWEERVTDDVLGILSVYDYRMRDLIDQELDEADDLLQSRNTARVDARGVEVGLRARVESGLAGYASYSFQRATNRDGDRKLTDSPEHLARLGVSCPIGRGLTLATQWRYESERLTVQQTEEGKAIETDSYFLGGLRLSTRTGDSACPWLERMQLALQISNLLDTTYQTPAGLEHEQAAITQNGRQFRFTMTCGI